MEDFIQFQDWFTQKYIDKSASRFWTFKAGLNIALQRGAMNFVETGCIRLEDDWGGGMSTWLLGEVCHKYSKHLWTVDISPDNIKLCQKITEAYKDNITYVINDSVAFLKDFNQQIDFLYLDSLDCLEYDSPDSPALISAQEHQLKEVESIWDKLSERAVILLDDNGFANGGKTKLTKQFLKQNGWIEVLSHHQSLWIRN